MRFWFAQHNKHSSSVGNSHSSEITSNGGGSDVKSSVVAVSGRIVSVSE